MGVNLLMLATIKQCISDLQADTSSFQQYFTNYVMEVQDRNIDQELAYMLTHNVVDVQFVDRAITDAFKGMM